MSSAKYAMLLELDEVEIKEDVTVYGNRFYIQIHDSSGEDHRWLTNVFNDKKKYRAKIVLEEILWPLNKKE